MKKFLLGAESYSSVHNLGLLLFRLYVGFTMAFAHGLGKIPPKAGFTGFIGSLGLPAPELMAWLAALSEFGGGLLIAIGLATRISAVGLGVTMVIAGFMVHGADPFAKKELAFLYLSCCVLLFTAGPGAFSVDRLISKK